MCTPKFKNYILAGYPLLWIETHEEHRAMTVFAEEMESCKDKVTLYSWDRIDGIKLRTRKKGALVSAIVKDDSETDLADPLIALDWAEKKMPENSVLFLLDWHPYAKKDALARKVRNLLPIFKSAGKALAIVSHAVEIPPELEKEISVIRFDLPSATELRTVLKGLCESAKADYPADDQPILEAALGMTAFEAENAFAVSLIEKRVFDQDVIRREKAAIVKKTGLLEVLETKQTLDDVGGLENVKDWFRSRANTFSEKAREYGLTPPKGALLVGIPGTGKSLIAKAVASALHRPCLRLDMGKVYGSYVGESESRIRQVLSVVTAVAPCVLFIDELEKAFAGTGDGDSDSHGTTKRVFGTFISWMSEKTADVFIVATANDVKSLPAALLRSGRFDVTFWVDLPGAKQREEIISIHLAKTKRDPKNFDLPKLSKACEGFSGAEIEVWIQEGLTRSYKPDAATCAMTDDDLISVVGEITPIARMMKTQIEESRKWSENRGIKMASKAEAIEIESAPTRRIGSIGRN